MSRNKTAIVNIGLDSDHVKKCKEQSHTVKWFSFPFKIVYYSVE